MHKPKLDQAILAILKDGNLSEFDLIKTLQQPPYQLFDGKVFADELSLFQTHFVVHNALYRLRDCGLAENEYDIDTLTTELRLIKLDQSANTELSEQIRPEIIKLREYYLDWQNFNNTDQSDVQSLLSDFWQRYTNLSTQQQSQLQQQQTEQALVELGFSDVPSKAQLKQRYKKLSSQYHPDKGGNNQAFIQLQQAYQIIKLLV